MRTPLLADLAQRTAGLRDDGLFKTERVIASPQSAHITLADGSQVLNLCANNYLGLADHPEIVPAAHDGARPARLRHGLGALHLRHADGAQGARGRAQPLPRHRRHDPLLVVLRRQRRPVRDHPRRAGRVISDALNHASIIDGIRLCKAQRLRYDNNDMAQLEQCLREAAGARYRLIATDGVFSMDGVIANLPAICDLADQYDAMVMVDDSHAVGFVGAGGRGTPEYCGVMGRIDIITGTLGKALGGASGGYTSGRQEIVDWLRQRSRPYLFSNTLAPAIAAATLHVLDLLQPESELQRQLQRNAARFRAGMEAAGFTLAGAGHPIIPVMLGDAQSPRRWPSACWRRDLRDRVQLPGGAPGQGTYPHADVGRAQRRRHRPGDRRVHRGRAEMGVLS